MRGIKPCSAVTLAASLKLPCLLLRSSDHTVLAKCLLSWRYSASPKHQELCFQRIYSLFSLFRNCWLALQRAAAMFCCISGWFYLEMTDLYLYIIRKALSVFTEWKAMYKRKLLLNIPIWDHNSPERHYICSVFVWLRNSMLRLGSFTQSLDLQ